MVIYRMRVITSGGYCYYIKLNQPRIAYGPGVWSSTPMFFA